MCAYIVSQDDLDQLSESNSKLKVNGVDAVLGTEIKDGDSLLVESGSGFAFYPYNPGWDANSSVYFQLRSSSGSNVYLGFDLGPDNKSATATYEKYAYGGDYDKLVVKAIQVDETTGTNNVYIIDSNKLFDVNIERFSGTPPDVFDYGVYILSVLELPFKVPNDLVLDPENIMLSELDTGISAEKVKKDKIRVNLGSISVPETENNLLDYANTKAKIHLPRIEPFEIDLDYVIGYSVSVDYIVDCYTGMATVNIYSSKTDEIIASKQVDLNIKIPYASRSDKVQVFNNDVKSGGQNDVKTPFIEIVRNDAVLPDGFYTVPITDEGTLSGLSGFIEVDEIDLASDATYSEKGQLVAALKDGIIIK